MDGSRASGQKRAADQRRPYEDSFFTAKVDGIMRIAGFIRHEDGTWHKPAIATMPVSTAGEVGSAERPREI